MVVEEGCIRIAAAMEIVDMGSGGRNCKLEQGWIWLCDGVEKESNQIMNLI